MRVKQMLKDAYPVKAVMRLGWAFQVFSILQTCVDETLIKMRVEGSGG